MQERVTLNGNLEDLKGCHNLCQTVINCLRLIVVWVMNGADKWFKSSGGVFADKGLAGGNSWLLVERTRLL